MKSDSRTARGINPATAKTARSPRQILRRSEIRSREAAPAKSTRRSGARKKQPQSGARMQPTAQAVGTHAGKGPAPDGRKKNRQGPIRPLNFQTGFSVLLNRITEFPNLRVWDLEINLSQTKKCGAESSDPNRHSQPRLPGSVVGEASMRCPGTSNKITKVSTRKLRCER